MSYFIEMHYVYRQAFINNSLVPICVSVFQGFHKTFEFACIQVTSHCETDLMKDIATNSVYSELMLTVSTFHQKKRKSTHFNLVFR